MVKKIIGICIPIYNEENNLSNLIDDIKLFIQNSKYKNWKLLFAHTAGAPLSPL